VPFLFKVAFSLTCGKIYLYFHNSISFTRQLTHCQVLLSIKSQIFKRAIHFFLEYDNYEVKKVFVVVLDIFDVLMENVFVCKIKH
jgi:hypothetical protein